MRKSQTSTTAEGIAAIRAIESEKPAGERICYDPFAHQLTNPILYWLSKVFSPYGERRAPGVQGYIVCRCRHFDEYLLDCLRQGVSQMVILGAGLDSHAYRENFRLPSVKYFEIDHPATQAKKVERVKKIFGQIPAGVVYVPVDFNIENLDKLYQYGYDRTRPAAFSWEGVTYYLFNEAVDSTLGWICANSAAGSSVQFDYVYSAALESSGDYGELTRMKRYQGVTGEGLQFGIPRGSIDDFLVSRGFTQVVNVDGARLQQLYCTGLNSSRAVSDHYAIARAEVDPVEPGK